MIGLRLKACTRRAGTMEVRVEERIFQDFPLFRRGIAVASGIQNQGISKELEILLSEAVESAGRQPIDVKADPRIVVWSEAHRRFGSNPNKFPPAHFSLIRRVQKPGVHLPFINKVVTIMNYNSIADVIPVGGDDLDQARRPSSLLIHQRPLNIRHRVRSSMWWWTREGSCVADGIGETAMRPASPKRRGPWS
jgi:hypothetical protein